jgi:hypothetical protein
MFGFEMAVRISPRYHHSDNWSSLPGSVQSELPVSDAASIGLKTATQ